ncbi:N-acetylmuramoyl-L-alanine amidase [Bifidobacterium favimelis]|uniref:N-acetylmuramoyl-L-alanine amidase n=1 Tax=Bifidobacterium favimelis TaxID=3122979 RepID=A0ABU8ZP32_9BIFI
MTIHWWGDPGTRPTFEGVVNTFVTGARGTSAHYVAEAGRVACLVDPDDRAWACGDGIGCRSGGNDCSISIECNPRQSDGDYETIAELVRDLRSTYGDLPLYPHKHWSNMACPGTYDLARIDRLARGLPAGKPAPAAPPAVPKPAPAPAPKPSVPQIAVDGSCGPATVKRWQQVMGTQADGVVSGQVEPDGRTYARPSLASCTYGGYGSQLIRAVQARLGLARDGLLGPATIRAIQAHLGVVQDGSFGPATVRALQARLNQGTF